MCYLEVQHDNFPLDLMKKGEKAAVTISMILITTNKYYLLLLRCATMGILGL